MGNTKNVTNLKLDHPHIKKLISFLRKLSQLKHSERLEYMKTITKPEVKLISELVYNFLHSNIKTTRKSLLLLKRLRKYLHQLSKKRISYLIKKKLLQTLKGLNILNIIIPLALNTLTD